MASLIRNPKDFAACAMLTLKPMLLIVGASVLFGALLRGAGLLVALGAPVMMSAWASRQFRWPVALALAVWLAVFSALVFVRALDVSQAEGDRQ